MKLITGRIIIATFEQIIEIFGPESEIIPHLIENNKTPSTISIYS